MLHQHRLQASRPLRYREEAGVQLLHQGCAPRQVSQHRLWSSIAVIGSHGVEDKRRVVIVSASPAPASSQAGQVPTPRAPKKKSKKLVDINGDVSKDLGNGMFQIKLENGVTVLAHLSGKIRQNRIKIVTGDKVTVELSPYDLTKGRLTYRFRPGEYDRLQQEAAQAQNAAASS